MSKLALLWSLSLVRCLVMWVLVVVNDVKDVTYK